MFFDEFFKDDWVFFYRFTLAFLKVMSSRMMQCDDMSDIVDFIKQPMSLRCLEEAKYHESIQNGLQYEGVQSWGFQSVGKWFTRNKFQFKDSMMETIHMTYEEFVADEI